MHCMHNNITTPFFTKNNVHRNKKAVLKRIFEGNKIFEMFRKDWVLQ